MLPADPNELCLDVALVVREAVACREDARGISFKLVQFGVSAIDGFIHAAETLCGEVRAADDATREFTVHVRADVALRVKELALALVCAENVYLDL